MNNRRRRLLQEVLSCPTAPFCERAVVEYVRCWAQRRGVTFSQDAAGNVLLSAGQAPANGSRWVFSAHMDHPGFVVTSQRGRVVRAEFRGGVAKQYFPGSRVRLLVRDGGEHVATVTSARKTKPHGFLDCRMELSKPADVPPGSIGMWDVTVFASRNGRIRACACDDLAGAAAVLAAMEEAISRGVADGMLGLLTRAEEVGYIGAMAACRQGTIPTDALLVGLETSKAQPAAKLGGGVVIRVGDKTRIFHEPLTAHIAAVAGALAKKKRNFRYVRQLMPGGTCETTAFCALGYKAAALCVPLGNYHNQHPRGHIAAEGIDEGDFDCLVELLLALVSSDKGPADTEEALHRRLDMLFTTRQGLLDEPSPWSPRQ